MLASFTTSDALGLIDFIDIFAAITVILDVFIEINIFFVAAFLFGFVLLLLFKVTRQD